MPSPLTSPVLAAVPPARLPTVPAEDDIIEMDVGKPVVANQPVVDAPTVVGPWKSSVASFANRYVGFWLCKVLLLIP